MKTDYAVIAIERELLFLQNFESCSYFFCIHPPLPPSIPPSTLFLLTLSLLSLFPSVSGVHRSLAYHALEHHISSRTTDQHHHQHRRTTRRSIKASRRFGISNNPWSLHETFLHSKRTQIMSYLNEAFTLPYPILDYPALSCPILLRPTLPYPTQSYTALPHPALPYPTLPTLP